MKLKVWGIYWCGTHRRIVAAATKKGAAELLGVTYYHFNEFASITANETEVALAMGKPGIVFECLNDYRNTDWKEIPSKP